MRDLEIGDVVLIGPGARGREELFIGRHAVVERRAHRLPGYPDMFVGRLLGSDVPPEVSLHYFEVEAIIDPAVARLLYGDLS